MKTKYMNSVMRILVITLMPAAMASAQPAPPPPGGVPAPPPPGGVPAPPPPEANAAVETVQGTVSQYLMNPNGEVDGLLLADGTQVHFPPHMSADLTQTVAPTNTISAQGVHENTVHFRAYTINNTATGQSVNESRPSQYQRPMPPELRGVTLKPLTAEGKIKVVLVAPRGEPDGVIMDNGTIVRVPPDLGTQYSAMLQVGRTFAASGFGTENQFGRCLQATALGDTAQSLAPIYGTAGVPPAGGPPPPPH